MRITLQPFVWSSWIDNCRKWHDWYVQIVKTETHDSMNVNVNTDKTNRCAWITCHLLVELNGIAATCFIQLRNSTMSRRGWQNLMRALSDASPIVDHCWMLLISATWNMRGLHIDNTAIMIQVSKHLSWLKQKRGLVANSSAALFKVSKCKSLQAVWLTDTKRTKQHVNSPEVFGNQSCSCQAPGTRHHLRRHHPQSYKRIHCSSNGLQSSAPALQRSFHTNIATSAAR